MDYFRIEHMEALLGIFTFLITAYLGIVVFIKNKNSWTSRLFFILSLLIDAYIIVNYLSLHPPQPTPENQLFWIRVVMFVCSFIGPTLLFLVNTFPGDKFKMKKRYLFPALILMTVSAAASLSNLVFKAIDYSTGEPLPIPGPGIPIFFLDFVGLFLLSFIVLIFKYKKSSGKEKVQNSYFLLGVVATFSFMAISTVIFVVILKTSATVFLGPLSSVILMIFIAYAIFKYGLFNLRLIATEGLVGVLTIILFSEGLLSGNVSGILFKFFFAILVGLLGVSLVKSVHKEIKQKDELSDLAASLETANIRLQELDKQKTEFLYIASHQLRTPLSILKGYIELIKDGAYGKVEASMVKVLGDMDINNEHLVKLVDQFLDISRIEQGRTKYEFAVVDICSLVDNIMNDLKVKAKQKKIEIKWECPKKIKKVDCDQEKIHHVIFNFIDNAIKYSDKGIIKVMFADEGKGVAVRVIDDGIGFEKADEVNFFQKFYRGDNVKASAVTGTGLGLYVCRKFIEAHNGRVWAHSSGLGKGSEFGFWIPLKHMATLAS
ncbi:MAG: PAS/PAC sensor signal transduction histidine kinase [Parcubacteria group bacterium Gr01-1014_13]|nr:MAG: PAS/PAC sensor signal transduction histidine kinase [Parcubacteria group bacterium Gr01-1014_13]